MPGEAIADIVLMTQKMALSTQQTDEQRDSFVMLIQRTRDGDTAAFEQLMIYTQHKVARTAWLMLGNHEDTRDATQEVFLRAFKYLKRFDTTQDFQGWLYRITINVCHDIRRKRIRQNGYAPISSETKQKSDTLDQRASSDDVEASALNRQRRAIIARALETLPEKERAAIVLHDLEGLSTEEVAHALGSSPATVRSQISTARTKLKRYCERFIQRKK